MIPTENKQPPHPLLPSIKKKMMGSVPLHIARIACIPCGHRRIDWLLNEGMDEVLWEAGFGTIKSYGWNWNPKKYYSIGMGEGIIRGFKCFLGGRGGDMKGWGFCLAELCLIDKQNWIVSD